MTTKNLFLFNGIVCLLFGIPLLIAPDKLLDLYMVEGDRLGTMGTALARAYASVLIGLGIALLIATKAQLSYGRKALLALITVGNTLLIFVFGSLTMSGGAKPINWSSVVLVLIWAIWGGILWAREKVGEG